MSISRIQATLLAVVAGVTRVRNSSVARGALCILAVIAGCGAPQLVPGSFVPQFD